MAEGGAGVNLGRTIVTANVQGLARAQSLLRDGIPMSVVSRLRAAVYSSAVRLQRHVKQDFLSGAPPGALNVQSGTLRRNINIAREDTPTRVSAIVGTNIVYGVAWELGLVPDRKNPGQTRPARPFLRPAYLNLQAEIRRNVEAAIGFAIKRAA